MKIRAKSPPPPEAAENAASAVSLGDLLGALAADITAARAQADAQAVRVARIYRGDPLLRTLPAPLFRLSEVSVDMPVALTEIMEQQSTAALPLSMIRSAIADLVLETLSRRGAPVEDSQLSDIEQALDTQQQRLAPSADRSRDPVAVGDEFLAATMAALSQRQRALLESESAAGSPDSELASKARALAVAAQAQQAVRVLATTGEVAAADRDSLVRLHIKFSERGLEWAATDSGDRLVPE